MGSRDARRLIERRWRDVVWVLWWLQYIAPKKWREARAKSRKAAYR